MSEAPCVTDYAHNKQPLMNKNTVTEWRWKWCLEVRGNYNQKWLQLSNFLLICRCFWFWPRSIIAGLVFSDCLLGCQPGVTWFNGPNFFIPGQPSEVTVWQPAELGSLFEGNQLIQTWLVAALVVTARHEASEFRWNKSSNVVSPKFSNFQFQNNCTSLIGTGLYLV